MLGLCCRPACFKSLRLSQIETVIRASKQLEQLLEQHYGASGRGLHEKTSSIEDQLDSDTVRRLRKIATLRNKVVHEDFEIDDLTDFQCDAQGLAQQLQPKTASTRKNSPAQKPQTRPPEQAKPADNATPRHTTKSSTSKTLTPQPRVQPRVKLPNDSPQNAAKKPQRKQQPTTAKAATHAVFPAISGILIFMAIIWILAH